MENFNIDFKALAEQIRVEAEYEFMKRALPDDDPNKELAIELFQPFIKRGISPSVAIEIINEIGTISEKYKRKENDEDDKRI